MKQFLLTKVRLSWYFIGFVVVYFTALRLIPHYKFEPAALTLFSVNSFLYGFYISPVLGAQKARIEELHRVVRSEANAIFSMVLFTKKMHEKPKDEIQSLVTTYLQKTADANLSAAEKAYESLITYCVDYKGESKDEVGQFLEKIVANQQNRTNFTLQVNNKVYSNEWMIMMVLFSITLIFILLLDTGSGLGLQLVTAFLCTGLTMLMINLVKLNTLTHKKARMIWAPFKTLISTRYYRID